MVFCAKLRAWPHNSLWPRLFLIDGLDIKKYERKETDKKKEREREVGRVRDREGNEDRWKGKQGNSSRNGEREVQNLTYIDKLLSIY